MSHHVTSCQYDTWRNVATTVGPAPQINAPNDITFREEDDDDDDTEEEVEVVEGVRDDARLTLVKDEKCEA